jgi:electron transport complex protein RnfD
MSETRLIVSPAPFCHNGNSVRSIMLDFIIALIPAAVMGFVRFGARALAVIAVCVASAVLAETLAQKATKRPMTLGNLHAVYLGFLFAMLLPSGVPLWAPVVGVGFALVVGKHFFGGIGCSPFHPVLLGWVVLILSWPTEITAWSSPAAHGAAQSAANIAREAPLDALFKYGGAFVEKIPMADLFWGRVAGPIGVCAAAVLAGGVYLVVRRRICLLVPASFLAGVFVFAAVAAAQGFGGDTKIASPLLHVLAGNTMLGAFFLSTEYSPAPVTTAGKIVFGLGCGVMVMLIRIFGLYPNGVPFAILFMSLWTPILDRVRPRVLGVVKEVRARA